MSVADAMAILSSQIRYQEYFIYSWYVNPSREMNRWRNPRPDNDGKS